MHTDDIHRRVQAAVTPKELNSRSDSYRLSIVAHAYAVRRAARLPVACFPSSIRLICADSKWLPLGAKRPRVRRAHRQGKTSVRLAFYGGRYGVRIDSSPRGSFCLCWPIARLVMTVVCQPEDFSVRLARSGPCTTKKIKKETKRRHSWRGYTSWQLVE